MPTPYELGRLIDQGADIELTARDHGLSPHTLRVYLHRYRKGLLRENHGTSRSGRRAKAIEMFRNGATVYQVCKELGLLVKTAKGYRWEAGLKRDPLLD